MSLAYKLLGTACLPAWVLLFHWMSSASCCCLCIPCGACCAPCSSCAALESHPCATCLLKGAAAVADAGVVDHDLPRVVGG